MKSANIDSTHFPDATSFISQFHKEGNTTAEHRYWHSLSLSPATVPGVCLLPALKGTPTEDASWPENFKENVQMFSISMVILSIFWQQKHSSVSIFHFYGHSVNILATEVLFCFYFPFPRLFCQYFGNKSTLLFLFSISMVILSIFWQQKYSSVSIFHFHGCSVNILATEALFSLNSSS